VSGGPQPLRGRKPGDRRIRIERPQAAYFRHTSPGILTARAKAAEPTTRLGRGMARIRGVLVGRPLASEQELEERLPKKKALAIFSSDAISSSAYAPEEILRVLVLAGPAALVLGLPVSIAIVVMLATVAISYRQVVYAYPQGGGSYSVARANFGQVPSLVAASALLIDYVMTVAVSTSSAVEQITSAVPELVPFRVFIGVGAIALITLGNLRGLRESGNIFALPTYLFVGSALLMIAIGAFRVLVLGEGGTPPDPLPGAPSVLEPVTIILLVRAFAGGAVALTGTEAIATGVRAFKPPESKNAATTLLIMAALLGVLFVGIMALAAAYGIVLIDEPTKQTIPAQVASKVYGADSIGFYLFQAFTALILFLAANTSFNAFPRLSAILAQDGYMPRQLSFRGDRLAFSRGIIALGVIAASIIVVFGGNTHAIIPLYAVGVFIDFTISQSGMVKHWLETREPGWRRRLSINSFGCVLTAIVTVVVVLAKAPVSLLVVVLVPCFVMVMLLIHRHYARVASEQAIPSDLVVEKSPRRRRVIIPIPGLTRAVEQAITVGRTIADDVTAVHITDDLDEAERVRIQFERQVPGVRLVLVESPYRQLVGPLVSYVDVMAPDPETLTFVILPEYLVRHWWERYLHNQVAERLRHELIGRPNTVIISLPYRRDH
jgi:amino acid transporter